MAGYDPNKAAAYNKLIQQGLSEEQAARQAGISEAEDIFYEVNEVGSNNPRDASYNPNFGKIGPPVLGANAAEYNKAIASGKTEQQAFAELQARNAEAKASRLTNRDEDDDDETFERSPVVINENTPPGGTVTQTNYTTTSTETVSGGGSTTTIVGPKISTAASEALQPAIDAKQAEIDQFNKDNPSNFARKRQGLPPLTPEENLARIAKQSELNDQATQLRNRQTALESATPPTVITVPNTTTTTQTVTTGTSSTNQAVDPFNDEKLSQENEAQLDATPSAANALTTREAAPVPRSAIERGDQTPPPGVSAPALVSPAADPYSGLTPEQIEFLGDADPTDPFIRARGGLPPLIQPVNVTEPTPVAGAPGLLDPQQRAEIITPAPAPVPGAPGLLDPQQQAAARIAAPEPVQDFVTDPETGELVPSDSVQAEQIRAEQNRVQTDAPAPVPRSAIEEGGDAEAQAALTIQSTTAESVPLTDAESAALFEEAEANTIQSTTAESVPLTDAESAALFEEAEANTIQSTTAEPVDDPFEAARLAAEEGEPPPTFEAEDLEDSPYEAARLAAEEGEPPPTFEAEDLEDSPYEVARLAGEQEGDGPTADEQVQVTAPAPVEDVKYDDFGNVVPNTPEAIAAAEQKAAEQQEAEAQAAAKLSAINQATLQSVYKAVGSSDWRVRLQLAPSSNYLYNVKAEDGGPGILGPLTATNGVIFPYTPQINTSYKANYEQYDLVHSNYRGVYYKNSRVDDLQIRGVFTAQDTNEANYLLAVIHFFRSVTKMFYGKDDQRGTPPPLVYLSGFGMNQFYGHPCVVTSFAYNLPDSVDYIRATSVNNYGTDLLSRRTASSPSSAAGLGATGNRLLNAGLANFTATPPAPSSVVASINNTQLANYVPTKMDIDITLIPVQTRSQVSKQFSLKGFANGDLIKGGFW